MTRLGLFASALSLIAIFSLSEVRADDQDVIDYRQHIMKTMGEQVAAIGQILQKQVAADGFVTHVEVLAITAATAKKAFEPRVAGGEARPDVWAQWADFSKRLDDLTAATADLAKTAKEGGLGAAGPKVQSTLTCKNCHDTFRVPKK